MKIEEIKTARGLVAIGEEWRQFQTDCAFLSPFHTWEWNALWWQYFGHYKSLRLLLFREPETKKLCGVAPLYVSRHRGLPLRRLTWLGNGHSDYLGILALPNYQDRVINSFKHYLTHTMRGWDYADLPQQRFDSPLLHSRCSSNLVQEILPQEPCPSLMLPTSWEVLLKQLGKKMRSNLGYYDRLLLRTHADVEYSLATEETLEAGMTALFDLHQRRWNARWLPGVLGKPRVQRFHRDVAHLFLERGWLRLHLLSIEGVVRAVLYCFSLQGRTFYYLGGFDPDLSRLSIGTLLNARAIQYAIEEGDTEFDFLRGNESYKYRWLPEVHTNQQVLLIPKSGLRSLTGQAGKQVNSVERSLEQRVKELADRLGRKKTASPKDEKE